MNSPHEIFPTFEKLVSRKTIEFNSSYNLDTCLTRLKQGNQRKYAGLKIAVYVDENSSQTDSMRFALQNWYGGVKVWAIGTIVAHDDKSVVVRYTTGLSQIDRIIYLSLPLISFFLFYDRANSFLINLIIFAIIAAFLYFIVWLAIGYVEGKLQDSIQELLAA